MFPTGTVEYEPGVAEWPGAATSSDAAATPQYRPYQPEALAGARVWYSTAAATDMNDDQGAAAAQTAEAGAAGSAAAGAPLAFRQQGPAADAEPNLIDLAAADELPATHIAAPAAAITHDSRYARGTGAAVPPSATAASREPPDLYVCPITQVYCNPATCTGTSMAILSCKPHRLCQNAVFGLQTSCLVDVLCVCCVQLHPVLCGGLDSIFRGCCARRS
jgi:hypothetical protein